MNLIDVTATLEYWQVAGIDVLTSDRLRFPPPPGTLAALTGKALFVTTPADAVAPPPRSVSATGRTEGGHPAGSPPPLDEVAPPTALTTPPLPTELRREKLQAMAHALMPCSRCQLSRLRTNMVFGVGHVEAPVVFVGEGPGAEEDSRGEPFVGDAGKLLDKMLAAIALQRQDVYIANVVKCRPPGNRNPLPDEIHHCSPFLFEQLEIIRPRVIFALGKFAIQCLTGHTGPIGAIRGKMPRWRGIPVIPSYHPAFYLRSPARKKEAWEDLIRLKKVLAS